MKIAAGENELVAAPDISSGSHPALLPLVRQESAHAQPVGRSSLVGTVLAQFALLVFGIITCAEGAGLAATGIGLAFFVPRYGYLGAAGVSTVAYTVSLIVMLFLSASHLQLWLRELMFRPAAFGVESTGGLRGMKIFLFGEAR